MSQPPQPTPMHYWKPSDSEWRLVSLPSKPWHKLRVKAVEGEANQFFVESETLICNKCDKQYGAATAARKRLKIGSGCLERGCAGTLESMYYRCDMSGLGLNGICNCIWFETHLAVEVSKVHPSQWVQCLWRCKHLQAAAALQQLMFAEMMERERHRSAPNKRKYNGP